MLKISACVIAKNEEQNLPRWLACAKAFADEIVVVDTGSTDRTAEIARAAGARVYSFAWRDDFAAAKNFAIQKARGNWIVFLDADEYFPTEDLPKVKALIHRFDREERTAGFLCPLVNIDVDCGNLISSGGMQIRVFRRHPDLRYQGAIHEQLGARSGAWNVPTVQDVKILHTGYSSSMMRAKLERNLHFLLAERKKRGEKWTDAYYLADCYFGLKRYEEAMEQAQKALACDKALPGMERRPYDVLLGSMLVLRRPSSEISQMAQAALERFPETPDYKMDEGIALWQEENYPRAEEHFAAALAMTEKGAGRIRAVILSYLADIEHRRGRDAKALDYAAESLAENRFSEWTLSILCEIFRPLPPEDVIAFLNTLYDASADAGFLLPILAKAGLHTVCLYYEKGNGDSVHG